MADQIRKRQFGRTAAALIEFDAGSAKRSQAWDDIEHTHDIACAEQDDRDALRKVQEAFHQDTADINCLDNCLRVDTDFMRKCVAGAN